MSFSKKPKKIDPNTVDPSVYYYDEVYDEKLEDDDEVSSAHREKKSEGSKYLEGMKEAAEKRKVEKEIRKFKRYARDREDAEKDGVLTDEDIFITSGYRKKLKEIELLKEGEVCPAKTKDNAASSARNNKTKRDARDQPVRHSVKDLQAARDSTLEERKSHLRKLSVKRTVGQAFKDAVERYKARRKISKHL